MSAHVLSIYALLKLTRRQRIQNHDGPRRDVCFNMNATIAPNALTILSFVF